MNCDNGTARFYGTLDYETLGGAGFASQRTTGDDSKWNLSEYAGIQLKIAKGDSMWLTRSSLPYIHLAGAELWGRKTVYLYRERRFTSAQ